MQTLKYLLAAITIAAAGYYGGYITGREEAAVRALNIMLKMCEEIDWKSSYCKSLDEAIIERAGQ